MPIFIFFFLPRVWVGWVSPGWVGSPPPLQWAQIQLLRMLTLVISRTEVGNHWNDLNFARAITSKSTWSNQYEEGQKAP